MIDRRFNREDQKKSNRGERRAIELRYARTTPTATIATVILSGDFIAIICDRGQLEMNSSARLDLGSVSHAVTKFFGHGENFFPRR